MAADGEVEIAVRAEGADQAADELAEGAEADTGGDGDGEGGGLAQAIVGGLFGGLLASAIKPLLKVLDPILKVLQAFLAPVAAMLMRLLSPVLRHFLTLLPEWYDFIEENSGFLEGIVEWLENLPSEIRAFLDDPLGWLGEKFKSVAMWLWEKLKSGDFFGVLKSVMSRLKDFLIDFTSKMADAIAEGLRKFFGIDQDNPSAVNPETGELRDDAVTEFAERNSVEGRREIVLEGDFAEWLRMVDNKAGVDWP